jgi:hypothetical protein
MGFCLSDVDPCLSALATKQAHGLLASAVHNNGIGHSFALKQQRQSFM